jgi:CheY-like chemotaxis protein
VRPKVLVVDDEPAIRDTLSFMLEMEGFQVAVAADGVEALARIAQDPPEVVLLDVMMPKLDGYRVCEAIKADPRTAGVKVVMLTAMGQAADRARALAAGADAYVAKPFDEDGLLTLLRQLAGKPGDA